MPFLKRLKFASLIMISIGILVSAAPNAFNSKTLNVIDDNEIVSLGRRSLLVYDNFLELNWPKIVHYNNCGKFFDPADSQQLFQQNQDLNDSLQIINSKQQKIQQLIADYEKSDWDKRFGRTNLWQQLESDIYLSNFMICYSDYFSAMANKLSKRNKIATTGLIKLRQFQKKSTSAKDKLLESKFLSLLGDNISAVKLTLAIIKDSNVSDEILWQAILQKLAIENIYKKNAESEKTRCSNLDKISEQFALSKLTNNLQICLDLNLLQKNCPSHNFKPLVSRWPQLSSIVGKIILTDLEQEYDHDQDWDRFNNFDIRLAAMVCLDLKPAKYSDLIDKLLKIERFQSVELFLAGAAAMLNIDQLRYGELLIAAAILHKRQPKILLNLDMEAIAKDAAKISCEIFSNNHTTDKDNQNRLRPIAIIADYNKITDCRDLPMVLAHGIMLRKSGQLEKAKTIFSRLAISDDTNICNRSKTHLALIKIRQIDRPIATEQLSLLNPLAKITPSDIDLSDSHFAIKFVSNIINKIENFSDPKNAAADCLAIVSKYKQCFSDDINILALEAESASIAGKFQILEKIMAGTDTATFAARIQARIAQSSGNHLEAAACWQTVLAANSPSNRYEQSYHWWRAKYYQLYNLHKSHQLDCPALHRNIAILQTSYHNIPAIWNQKLSLLDQNCNN